MIAMMFAHVWGILELTVLASLTRTIRVRTALAALAAGLYACPLIAILLQTSWTRLAARLTGKYLFEIVKAGSYTLDPFIEEVVKVLPLLILLWMIPSVRRQWSTADCILIGAASGAGFGMAENLFRLSGALDRVIPVRGGWEIIQVFSVSDPTVPSLTSSLTSWLPAGIAGENALSSALSPDRFNLHLEWSALAGFAVALIFLFRSKLSRISGIALWLYVAADHAASNLTVSGRTGTLSLLAVPLNSLRHILCLMPAIALLIAWLLDRHRQQASQAPDFALATELSSTSRVSGILRSALSRPPRSILWVGTFVRLRRAYAASSACYSERSRTLRQAVLNLRNRIDRLVSGLDPSAVIDRTTFRSIYSIIRQPKIVVWLLLILPTVTWLMITGLPQALWLQSAIKTPLGWTLIRIISVLGLMWMGLQLLRSRRILSQARATALADGPARASLRLASGAGAFLLGIYGLILAITEGPGGRLISNFHVLEAIAAAQLLGTQMTALLALGLFPPAGGGLGELTRNIESGILSGGNGSSDDLSKNAQDTGVLRPQGDLTQVGTVNENVGVLRPGDGPLTLETVFDGAGNQILPKPDDLSDLNQRLLHTALDSSGMAAEKIDGEFVKGLGTAGGVASGFLDAAEAYYDQDQAKLIQSVLTTSLPLVASEADPLLLAKGVAEIGARLAGMSSEQINAVEDQATKDALGSLGAASGAEVVRKTSEALEKLFSGKKASGEQEQK